MKKTDQTGRISSILRLPGFHLRILVTAEMEFSVGLTFSGSRDPGAEMTRAQGYYTQKVLANRNIGFVFGFFFHLDEDGEGALADGGESRTSVLTHDAEAVGRRLPDVGLRVRSVVKHLLHEMLLVSEKKKKQVLCVTSGHIFAHSAHFAHSLC